MKMLYLVLLALLALRASAQSLDGDPDVIEFALITDTHQYGSTIDVRQADASVRAMVEYCNSHPQLQFALYGGDLYNAYDSNHRQALRYLRRAARRFGKLNIPLYTTRGNHDCNGKCHDREGRPDNSQIVTDAEYYRIFSPLSPSSRFYAPEGITIDPAHPKGNYYYRDFEKQRFRLIVLNYYDRDLLEIPGVHYEQLQWLKQQALNFSSKAQPEQWCFLLLCHSYTIDHQPINQMLRDYVKHSKAHMVGILSGHYHQDMYENSDGYNILRVNRGYATGIEVGDEREDICFDHFILNTRAHTLEERRIGRGRSRLFSYDTSRLLSPKHAFAEAWGFGEFTQGGTGSYGLHVTSLADEGSGSLRWAISQAGSHKIVFDVAGEINLCSPLVIDHDSITISGNADKEISIIGAPLVINASETVLRYLRVGTLSDGDFGHRQLLIDHVTAHNDTASAIVIRHTSDVTVQYCEISSGSATEPALIAGGTYATYHHNLISDSPYAIGFPNAADECRYVQIGRSVIRNWSKHAIAGGGYHGEANIHENYLIPGQNTTNYKLLDVASDGTCRYFVRNNYVEGFANQYQREADMVNDLPGKNPKAPSCITKATFPACYFIGGITHTEVYREVIGHVGNKAASTH